MIEAHLVVPSPVGPLRLTATPEALRMLELPSAAGKEGPHAAEGRVPPGRADTMPHDRELGGDATHPVLAETARQLAAYFAGALQRFDVPLDLVGTGFQRRCWEALLTIPFGVTWSYGELAAAIGRPAASRAVGGANHRNPIAIIVPCHRVIGSTGSLTGYGGGLDCKKWLLTHEHARPRSAQASLAIG